MTRTNIFYLTGLLLAYWRESDAGKALSNDPTASTEDYRLQHMDTVRAAKRANHEALSRMLRTHPIPYPWEGMGGLES